MKWLNELIRFWAWQSQPHIMHRAMGLPCFFPPVATPEQLALVREAQSVRGKSEVTE